MKSKLALVVIAALLPVLLPMGSASADNGLAAAVAIPSATYDGTGNCVEVPVTLNVWGGVSNGFAYWTTENESLVGPTSSPSPVGFFFDNEQAPGTASLTMCPYVDHAGVYTYSADVWFHNWSSEGGDRYAGHVSATFALGLAATTITKVARHVWQVRIVGRPYLVPSPRVRLQKFKNRHWRTISSGYANSAGKLKLKSRAPGKYRLAYRGDSDRGLLGATSKVFRRP